MMRFNLKYDDTFGNEPLRFLVMLQITSSFRAFGGSDTGLYRGGSSDASVKNLGPCHHNGCVTNSEGMIPREAQSAALSSDLTCDHQDKSTSLLILVILDEMNDLYFLGSECSQSRAIHV